MRQVNDAISISFGLDGESAYYEEAHEEKQTDEMPGAVAASAACGDSEEDSKDSEKNKNE